MCQRHRASQVLVLAPTKVTLNTVPTQPRRPEEKKARRATGLIRKQTMNQSSIVGCWPPTLGRPSNLENATPHRQVPMVPPFRHTLTTLGVTCRRVAAPIPCPPVMLSHLHPAAHLKGRREVAGPARYLVRRADSSDPSVEADYDETKQTSHERNGNIMREKGL